MSQETRTFQTNLSCGSCVETVKPFLEGEPSISQWNIDTDHDLKLLTVTAPTVDEEKIRHLLKMAGYELQKEIFGAKNTDTVKSPSFKTYAPLLLILAYLLTTLLFVHPANFMAAFMGGFFLIFSFFKLLNLKAFADAYQTYDLLAARSRFYAYLYPFIELGLGLAYVGGIAPKAVNLITLIVMLISLGVIESLRKQKTIECACLGTVFKLPMTRVTLFEDLLMVAMAAFSLVMMSFS
jgi:copper chaperone CopZ